MSWLECLAFCANKGSRNFVDFGCYVAERILLSEFDHKNVGEILTLTKVENFCFGLSISPGAAQSNTSLGRRFPFASGKISDSEKLAEWMIESVSEMMVASLGISGKAGSPAELWKVFWLSTSSALVCNWIRTKSCFEDILFSTRSDQCLQAVRLLTGT
jgi:hypothetical protein